MKVNIEDFVKEAGLDEPLYPGKRVIRKYVQHGEFKSHSVVFNWHDRDLLKVELIAGVSGRIPDAKELRHYPVSFQAATYMDIDTSETDDTEDEDGESSRGKSGGGGKKPARKRDERSLSTMGAFAKMAEGTVSAIGEIKKFVVMGKEIAREAYAQAFENLKAQLSQTKIMAMDLMKGVSDIIKVATPGGGLTARGGETLKYQYDAEKTAPMFGGPAIG